MIADLLAFGFVGSTCLAIGHIIGAWPGDLRRSLDSKQAELNAAITDAGRLEREAWNAGELADNAKAKARAAEQRAAAAERQYLTLHQQLETGDPE